MRLRYKLVTYHFGEDRSDQQRLQRHYKELMDELLRQGQHHALTHRAVQWRPATDIHETPDAIVVKMELAGMREEDIEVTLFEDALVVTGRREDDADHDSAIYFHEAQIRYGPFRAEVLLPGRVQRDGVDARYENGFLRVTLPKVLERTTDEVPEGETRRMRASTPSQPLQATGQATGQASGAAPLPQQPHPRGARGARPAGRVPRRALALTAAEFKPAPETLFGFLRRGGLCDA